MSALVSVRSSLRVLAAVAAVVAGVGAQVVQASPASAEVLPSLSSITAPSDISASGPFSISGHVDNADLSDSTALRVQLDLDSSGLTSAVDAGMVQGTCDVGATTGVAVTDTDPSVGVVSISCPTVFTVPASGTVAFTISLGLSAPSDDTGTLAGTVHLLADSTSEDLTTAPLPAITVHHAPALTVTAPASVDDNPTAFSGTLDNTDGIAGTNRLEISVTDGSGMGTVTPDQITLDCAVTVQGGSAGTTQPVALAGTSVAQGLSGSCPSSAGYALAADEIDTFDFHISFDAAVPSTGTVKLTFALVPLDGGGAPLSPALVTTAPATVAVFPPPTVTTSPPTVLATGAGPKSYAGSIDDPTNGRDYANIRMRLTLSGITGLTAAQVYASCDGGSSAVALSAAGSTLTGQCTPMTGTAVNRGDSLVQAFQLCVNGAAPTGTLSLETAVLDGSGGPVLYAEPAHSVSVIAGKNGTNDCHAATGATLVWTGPSGGDWTDAANWDGGVAPGVDDTAVVPPSSSITNVHGGVANLVLDGGSDSASAAALAIAGSLEVGTEADLSGHVVLTDEPGLSPAPGLTVNALLSTAAGTDVELGNDANVIVPLTATATLATSTKLHRPATPSDTGSAPAVELGGKVQPAGTATLDQVGLQVAGGGEIDAHGATLALVGPSSSSMAGTAVLEDLSSGGGILQVGDQAQLAIGGTTTKVDTGALLKLLAGSTLTDDGSPATINGPATGSSALDWEGGTLAGHLTLGQTLTTFGLTLTDQKVALGAVITNKGQLKVQAPGAPGVEVEGAIDNQGQMTIRPGAFVFGTASNSPVITNEVGSTLGIEAPAGGGQPNSTPAVISGVGVHNLGNLALPIGESLRVRTATVTLDAGSLTGGGTPTTPSTGSALPPGTIAVGSGASAHVIGTVTMSGDAVLALDDVAVSGASAPVLSADTGAKLVAPASATAIAGVVHWCAGKVDSSLTVAANIKTEIGVGAAAGSCLANSTAAVNLGAGADSSHRHVLRLDGPASVNNATVFSEPHTELNLNNAAATLGGGAVFDHTGVTLDDEVLRVGSSGQLSMPSLRLPSLFTTTHPTVKIPFIVDGRMTADSPLALNAAFTNHGTTYIAANTTATETFVTTDTVTIFTSTLDARKGYVQKLASGGSTPVTQLNDAQAKLTTTDGAATPHLAPVTISNGGFVGGGTVTASSFTLGSGFLRPSPFNNGTVHTMNLQAPLHLSKHSDVQFIVYKAKRDLLKVTKAASLTGRITGFTGTGYTPKYLVTISSVMTFPSHTGKFTATSWGGTPVGLGWKPVPLTSTVKHVDLRLVDVAPPALGIASIPAFTEFAAQRVTYFAVDNKTGVRNFDVRWRRGSSTHGWTSWRHPSAWQRTTATSETLSGMDIGWEYCMSIRARDKVGNVTPWSQPLCTQRMYDDRAMTASGSWSRKTGQTGFYNRTYSRSTHYGNTLSRSGTHSRIAVTAYHCSACGVIQILDGGHLVGTIDLSKGATGLRSWVSKERASKSSRVVVKVVTRGKSVVIDAFGLRR